MAALIAAQPYAPGTIDWQLLQQQTLLTPETRSRVAAPPTASAFAHSSHPRLEQIVAQAAAGARDPQARIIALMHWCHHIPRDYPSRENSTAGGCYGDFSSFCWGGDEETVIAKGSPWPQELARVLVVLAQIAGLPARLVFLYRAQPAALHTVVEVWLLGSWAVFDACANRFYLWPHRGYASALDLSQQPRFVDQMPEHGRNPYVDSGFYRTLGIAAYTLGEREAGVYRQQPARPHDLPLLQQAAAVFGGR